MSRIASTRPLRSTRSRRRRRWRNLPTNGPQRASRISGAAFPSFKRCKAKPARPACCMVRCNRVRSRRRSRHRKACLLMIHNMYKIAGELTPAVFHVAARALATSALSIFGDHSDVMAVRNTGFALISSGNVQEAHDTALIAQTATLESRIPFLHFFDGFRTSHELNTLDLLSDEQIRAMISDVLVRAHRERSLSPEHPFIRGTAHNPDTYFQAREASNVFYDRVPGIVQAAMDRFAQLTSRQYQLFEYDGACALCRGHQGRRTASSFVSALLGCGLHRGAAVVGSFNRRARGNQRAGSIGRTAVPRRDEHARAGRSERRARADAACDRRPVRHLIQRLHAGYGQNRL